MYPGWYRAGWYSRVVHHPRDTSLPCPEYSSCSTTLLYPAQSTSSSGKTRRDGIVTFFRKDEKRRNCHFLTPLSLLRRKPDPGSPDLLLAREDKPAKVKKVHKSDGKAGPKEDRGRDGIPMKSAGKTEESGPER